MQFKDEFEVPTESGKTYYVEVEGNTTEAGVDLELVTIYDGGTGLITPDNLKQPLSALEKHAVNTAGKLGADVTFLGKPAHTVVVSKNGSQILYIFTADKNKGYKTIFNYKTTKA